MPENLQQAAADLTTVLQKKFKTRSNSTNRVLTPKDGGIGIYVISKRV